MALSSHIPNPMTPSDWELVNQRNRAALNNLVCRILDRQATRLRGASLISIIPLHTVDISSAVKTGVGVYQDVILSSYSF